MTDLETIPFLVQQDGPNCVLYAMVNACIWFNHQGASLKVPKPGDKLWNFLVLVGAGEHGPFLKTQEVANRLGMQIGQKEEIPLSWTKPEGEVYLFTASNRSSTGGIIHTCLCIGGASDGRVRLVNFLMRSKEAIQEVSLLRAAPPLGNPNRIMYRIELLK